MGEMGKETILHRWVHRYMKGVNRADQCHL